MRRFLALIALLFAPVAWATTTVTGQLQNLGTGTVGQAAFVRFWLRGCGGNQPRVNGTAVIAPSQGGVFFFDFTANSSGNVSGTLYSTRDVTGLLGGDITCGTSTTSVWYGMQVFVGGKGGPEIPVHALNTATLNISSVTPITTTPVVTAPTGDSTYLRKDAGNSPVTGPLAVNNSFTVTGLISCKNFENAFCIDAANTQGWTGADFGAQINNIIAQSACGNNCAILVAPGTYTMSTAVSFTTSLGITCLAPVTGGSNAVINWTPATGTAFTSNTAGASFQLRGCFLNATANTSSIAIKLKASSHSHIDSNHITGFTGGIQITGDGVSQNSIETFVTNNRVDGFCGTGSYGISLDHANDTFVVSNAFYSTLDCTTSQPMIVDTGVGGLWLTSNTFEQGLHAGIIRSTNQGGSYGSAPSAIFPHAVTWDLSTGGDALLFDSTLGTADMRFFCDSCWVAGAGKNNAGSVITSGAVGLNIQGGANIHWVGGTARVNSSWGAVLATSGDNISIEDSNFHANNQSNTAGIGGIQVTNPLSWRLTGNRGGNIVEGGGHQAFGADLSGAINPGFICANDFSGNTTNQFKLTGSLSNMTVNANVCGSTVGLASWGPLLLGTTVQNLASSATMGLTLKKGSGAGNYTNATTSYIVADSSSLCFTVTIPTGWKLGVSASGALATATAAVVAQAALTDNAACSTANAGILVETAPIQGAGIGIADAFSIDWVITGDGASHNIALQFKTSNVADTASLINSSATIVPTMKFELMPSN